MARSRGLSDHLEPGLLLELVGQTAAGQRIIIDQQQPERYGPPRELVRGAALMAGCGRLHRPA